MHLLIASEESVARWDMRINLLVELKLKTLLKKEARNGKYILQ